MTSAIVFGTGAALGVLMIASVLVPRRVTLAEVLAVREVPTITVPVEVEAAGWAARLGRPLVPLLATVGLPRAGLSADLELCGRTRQRHAAEQATAIAAGLLGPHLLFGLLWLAGTRPGWVLPVWLSLAGAVVAAVVVDARVRRLAAARRVALRQALSVQLDLTMMGLAGGAGVEQALTDAAVVGNGWAHDQLRRALSTARNTRIPIWTALGELGARTGVNELVELSAAVALAGHEGAKIRATLGARAAAMRQRQTFDQETKAASATERMTLPSVLLLAAFMATIGYPAIATILTGL